MTKTLTEQWREGKLQEDTYYVQFICGRYGIYEFEQFKGFGFDNDLAYIKEVLAPVPSYDEYKELVFKANMPKNPVGDTIMCYDTERERAAVEKLQEQLKEANEVITMPEDIMYHDELVEKRETYLVKWGVK